MPLVKEALRDQQKILHRRFDDISVYLQYLDLKGFDATRIAPGMPNPDSIRLLRSNILSLQRSIPHPASRVMALAPAAFARKRPEGQHACQEHPELRRFTTSPNGQIFATYGLGGHAALWDTSTGLLMHELKGHSGRVCAASFCANGSTLATSSEDTTVRLWRVSTGDCMRVLEGHSTAVNTVSWNHGGMLVSCSQDNMVKWWDAEASYAVRLNEADVLTALWRKTDALNCSVGVKNLRIKSWSVDGMVVSCAGQSSVPNPDFSVTVVEGLSCRPVPVVLDPAGSVTCVCSTNWGQNIEHHYCAVGCSDNNVRVFFKHYHQSVGQGVSLKGHTAEITALAWGPDEQFLASCSADCTIRLWAKTSDLMSTSGLSFVRVLEGHTGSVTCAAWSPDACKLLTGSEDGTERLWNVATGALERVLQELPAPVTSVAFSGRDVLIASDNGALRIHRVGLGMF